MQLRGKMTPEVAKQQGGVDAEEALQVCVRSLEGSMKQLNITTPRSAKVSGAYPPLYRT
jgi:hypothetical protein